MSSLKNPSDSGNVNNPNQPGNIKNQPAPEKCPRCDSSNKEFPLFPCNVSHDPDPWHGVLPVEPQPKEITVSPSDHICSRCLRMVPENFPCPFCIAKPRVISVPMSSESVSSGYVQATKGSAVETVPVVPPQGGSHEHFRRVQTEGIANAAENCAISETGKKERPDTIRVLAEADHKAADQSGVVPQAVRDFWIGSAWHSNQGAWPLDCVDFMLRFAEAYHAAASQAAGASSMSAEQFAATWEAPMRRDHSRYASALAEAYAAELKTKIAELELDLRMRIVKQLDAERERDQAREALRKALEWAANYPLQGEASNMDAMASEDVYQAATDALAAVPPSEDAQSKIKQVLDKWEGVFADPRMDDDYDAKRASEDAPATPTITGHKEFTPTDTQQMPANGLLAANEIMEEFFMNHAEKRFNTNEGRCEFIASIIRKWMEKDAPATPQITPKEIIRKAHEEFIQNFVRHLQAEFADPDDADRPAGHRWIKIGPGSLANVVASHLLAEPAAQPAGKPAPMLQPDERRELALNLAQVVNSWHVGVPEQTAPIPLNDEQLRIIKEWAADDRLWTTPETVEFNLEVFGRAIIAANTRTNEAESLLKKEGL